MINEEARPMEIVTERPSGVVENLSKTTEVNLDESPELFIPNYVIFLRELFVGLIGVHAVYIFVNFIFKNYPGSLLSLLLTISAIYTHFDRRVATYSLNTGVEVLLGITIGFSVQGFEKYFDDPDLKRITLPQLVYCTLFAFISVILARFEYNFRQKKILTSKRT